MAETPSDDAGQNPPTTPPTTRPAAPAAPAGNRPSALLGWTLATFHTAALVAIAVTLLHLRGAAGDLLGGLDTRIGVAAFLLLWATTWWTTRRWLAATPLAAADRPSADAIVARGMLWGGANGLLVFGVGVAVVILPNLLDVGLDGLPILVALLLVGAAIAFAVGALVGGLLAVVDLGCWWAAGWLVEPSAEPGDRT